MVSDGWTNKVNDAKEGVKIDSKTSVNGFNEMRAFGEVPFAPMLVFKALCNPQYTETYDKSIAESRLLRKICANTYSSYDKTKPEFMIAARDFVTVVHNELRPDGSILFLFFSDDSIENEVPAGKPVRAKVFIAGHLLEPVPGEPNKTNMSMTYEFDFGGSLIKSVIAASNTEAGYLIVALRKTLEKYCKDHKISQ